MKWLHPFKPFLQVTLFAVALPLSSALELDPYPFGQDRGKDLDRAAVGEWWKQDASRESVRFIQERPRDKVLAFALYTQDAGVLKMTAQLFPLMPNEPDEVTLEVLIDGEWQVKGRSPVVYPGWSAHFRLEDWDGSVEAPYRLSLGELSEFEGLIRKDPKDKDTIVVASMSCNSPRDKDLYGRNEYVENIRYHDPDLLFFAGDQSYHHKEHTYGFLQWGVQFAEVLKDRPSVVIPDDHDVGQGNLWGEGGIEAASDAGDTGGFYYPASFVKMVERCQTSHLPDAFDPKPIARGIGVYYTRLRVGGVDFAIIEDRKFKSGPNGKIPQMGPRPDHIHDPAYERSAVDVEGLTLLGDRQLLFLEEWGEDWSGAELKAVLSQTAFCGAVHLHASVDNRLLADLDCNGWPQTGRNNALSLLRKAQATHLCGDQHLSVVVKHGIESYRDGPYAFTNPALVNTIYGRWWWPEDEKKGGGEAIRNDLPWTGDYEDGLGNKITMYAYANPKYEGMVQLRNNRDSRADGYGLIRFTKSTGDVAFEAWPRFSNPTRGESEQFEGWPVRFNVDDNDGRSVAGYLPTLRFKVEDPVVQVLEESTGEVLYTRRVRGKSFAPPVFSEGVYTVKAGKDRATLWERSGLEASGKAKGRINVLWD